MTNKTDVHFDKIMEEIKRKERKDDIIFLVVVVLVITVFAWFLFESM